MQTQIPLTRDLVLIGGGHAHALVLRMWGMRPLPGVRLTVINPGPTAPYSGMLPGHVAGHYPLDALEIDLVQLARFAGARLILGAADGIDPGARVVTVGDRRIGYDIASVDIGIHYALPSIPGFAEQGIGAKPLDGYAARWRDFLETAASGRVPPQVAVIGGGVAGVELALAMDHALKARGLRPEVAVLEAGPGLSGMSDAAERKVRAALSDAGVTLRTGARITGVTATHVDLDEGAPLPARFTLGAAGAAPHDWITRSSLPLENGFIRVGPDLRVEGRSDLFAVGDCAHMTHAPRPKAGVYAVRAAKVLDRNLRAVLTGGDLRPYRPQKGFLKLVSLGGKTALADKAGFA
uniref:FAD-dependent oxidoreductase n=1 Tax=Mesobacterium pallidum TaxID=2872037 RepID=UPI001EE2CE2F